MNKDIKLISAYNVSDYKNTIIEHHLNKLTNLYVSQPQHILGLERGTILYQTASFYLRSDVKAFKEEIKLKGLILKNIKELLNDNIR